MTASWIFAILFLICGFCLQHPFVTYPLSLRVFRALRGPVRSTRLSGTRPRRCAVVCCAHNEEAVIEDRARNFLEIRARNPDLDLAFYVYIDGSTDRTAALLAPFANEITVIIGSPRAGKSAGMNRILDQVDSDIVVFTDANVTINPERFPAVLENFADPEIGCVCGQLDYVNAAESATAEVGARYWKFEEAIKALETATGSVIGADGSLFAIRRTQFRPVPIDIIDDFFTSVSILCDGSRIILDPRFVAYERSTTQSDEEYRRKIRIACRAFNCHRHLWPRLRQLSGWNLYKYLSHRFLRWLAGFFMAGAVCAAIGFLLSIGEVGLPILLAGLASFALFSSRPPVLSTLREASWALIGTSVGVWKSLKGERFVTWSAATSTRVGPID